MKEKTYIYGKIQTAPTNMYQQFGGAGGLGSQKGEDGQGRQTGGGSGGGVEFEYGGSGGQGSAGTSYSGGAGRRRYHPCSSRSSRRKRWKRSEMVDFGIIMEQEEEPEIQAEKEFEVQVGWQLVKMVKMEQEDFL